MCVLLDLRRQSYAAAMTRVLAECTRLGVADLWATDLRRAPSVRAAALRGDVERLAAWIEQALHHGARIGFGEAVCRLRVKRAELRQLRREVAARDDVPAKGRRGRAAKIRAWIVANRATWQRVAAKFSLAESTARRYVREAKRQ